MILIKIIIKIFRAPAEQILIFAQRKDFKALPPGQETSQNASIIKVFYMSISADFYRISCIFNDFVLSISSLYSNAHGAVQSSESPRAPQNTKPAPRGLQNCPECMHYKGFLRVHFQQIPLNLHDFHDFFTFSGPPFRVYIY